MLETIGFSKLVSKTNVREEKDETIDDLVESIKTNGLLQPLAVRELSNGKYEILAGHRRYEALKRLNVDFVEVNVLDDVVDTEDVIRIQLAENIQRQNMSAFEYVKLFDMLKDKYDISDAKLALFVNKSYSWIRDQYTAVKILKKTYGSEENIPFDMTKKSASTIKAMSRRNKQESKTYDCNGFSVTVKKHSYIIYCTDFDFETKLNKFLEENGKNEPSIATKD